MKTGFIGVGNMGGAILRGCIAHDPSFAAEVYVNDADRKKVEQLKQELGIHVCADNHEVVKSADMLILCVKPNMFVKVFGELKDDLREEQLIVSIVSSISIEEIESIAGKKAKIVRVMPNTPAQVNEGMTSLSRNSNITDEDMAKVAAIFNAVGKSEEMDEKLIPSVIAVSGSSPAYVFMFIEALADAGVKAGMPRDKAYKFSAQAVKGAAEMVLKTGFHPGYLKDMVCSPGGQTIEAVRVLEEKGMRSAVIEAAYGAAATTAAK